MNRLLLLLGIVSMFMVSCEDITLQSEIDEDIIKNYIADNNLNATRHASGLYYVIYDEGSGSNPTVYSDVKVSYEGYLTDGQVFDSGVLNYYPLTSLITGWQIGVPLIKQGGRIKLIVPSALGYGQYGSGDDGDPDTVDIPGNAVIIFDITLIDYR